MAEIKLAIAYYNLRLIDTHLTSRVDSILENAGKLATFRMNNFG